MGCPDAKSDQPQACQALVWSLNLEKSSSRSAKENTFVTAIWPDRTVIVTSYSPCSSRQSGFANPYPYDSALKPNAPLVARKDRDAGRARARREARSDTRTSSAARSALTDRDASLLDPPVYEAHLSLPPSGLRTVCTRIGRPSSGSPRSNLFMGVGRFGPADPAQHGTSPSHRIDLEGLGGAGDTRRRPAACGPALHSHHRRRRRRGVRS